MDLPEGYQNQKQFEAEAPEPNSPENRVQYQGYDNIGFIAPIETYANEEPPSNESRPAFQEVSFISESEAKEALAHYVSEHCCYGKGPVKTLKVTNMRSSNTFRYILQTFTEARSTEYVFEPYYNQPIYNTGPPPQPWDIVAKPLQLFQPQLTKIEIPNTAHVETCRPCMGMGTRICSTCNGRGRRMCTSCGGRGNRIINNQNEWCSFCSGSGVNNCISCNCTGRVTCSTCKGSGRLKWFLQLKVEFQNMVDDYIKNSDGGVPDDLIRTCVAKNIFSEQNSRVFSIKNHPDIDINQASNNLINTHFTKYAKRRTLAQKHELNIIPITVCNYDFKDKNYIFHVYGLDNQVFAPDYPRKCLCCTIL